jgi:hypothetical protein
VRWYWIHNHCDLLSLSKDWIGQKSIETLRLFVLNHSATDCHHERNRGIGFLVRPALRRIQVAASVRPADDIADAGSSPQCRDRLAY